MKRVAYYLRTAGFGGVEVYLLALLRALDRSQFDPCIYFQCLDPVADERMRQELAALRVPIHELDEDGLPLKSGTRRKWSVPLVVTLWKRPLLLVAPLATRRAWYYWKQIRMTASAFRAARLDLIHFLHGCYPLLEIPVLASWLAGIRIRLSDVHSEPQAIASKPLLKRSLAFGAAHTATHVRVLGGRFGQQLHEQYGLANTRVRVIESGLDPAPWTAVSDEDVAAVRRELGVPAGARLVMTVARLSPEKGQAVLIEAAAQLRDRHADVHYVLVGEGATRAVLEGIVAARGLQDRVHFVGFRRDVPAMVAAADVIVIPSLVEGLPWALLEAMAAGKPVVATEVGGVSEALVDGEMGRVVPLGNVAAMTQALDDLLSASPDVLARMGQRARQRVLTRYSRERMLNAIFALYQVTEQHA